MGGIEVWVLLKIAQERAGAICAAGQANLRILRPIKLHECPDNTPSLDAVAFLVDRKFVLAKEVKFAAMIIFQPLLLVLRQG